MPLMFVLLFGCLMLAAGGTLDIANILRVRSHIQEMADSAALAGAREYRLSNVDSNVVKQVALSFADGALSSANVKGKPQATVNDQERSVTVTISATVQLRFMKIGSDSGYPVSSKAIARAGSSNVVCVLALGDGSANLGIDNGKLLANNCNSHSDSMARDGLVVNGASKLTSKVICTSGGYVGSPSAFSPDPTIDCPLVPDPLSLRSAPSETKCDFNNFRVQREGLQTLRPGVYCGGLVVDNQARVRLAHGTYVMKDGPLVVTNGASLTMVDAGVYLTGRDAFLYFDYNSSIDLRAPVSGPMAGILFFEDRNSPTGRVHQIGSHVAPQILGTVYLSRGKLVVGQAPADGLRFDCTNPLFAHHPIVAALFSRAAGAPCPPQPGTMAAQSAWTLIVAREVVINGGVTLVVNSNYDNAPVTPPSEFMKDSTILTR